ncbi:MAG: hypothetical protein JXB39_08225 [Deltaproteobacteria bacterium]|nr:hypothetical protein [Deltaproteobacteria bacterium]
MKHLPRLLAWSILVLALGSCGDSRKVARTSAGIVVTGTTFEERLDSAVLRAAKGTLGTEAKKALQGVPGAVLVDAPSKVTGLPEGTEVKPLLGEGPLGEALFGTDEEAAARKVLESGSRVVIVHWRLRSSVDRGGSVLAKLYHHSDLSWFSLFRVTDELFLYRVLDQPVEFPPALAAVCIAALRSTLSGQGLPPLPDVKAREGAWDLVASVRGQGRELAVGLAHSSDLRKAILELASDLERAHRRNMEIHGFPPLKDHIPDLSIEIHRITELAVVEPRGEQDLEGLWELGMDGAIIRDFESRKSGVFPGAVAYTRALRTADDFLIEAAAFHRLDARRPWRDDAILLQMFRTHHFREYPGKGIVYLFRGVPPVPIEAVTLRNTERALLRAAEWYLANQRSDGSVTYKWWPAENRESNEYNIVRHTLATWNLSQAWHIDPRPEFLEGAARAQDYTLQFLVREGDMAYFTHQNNTKLGTVVVGLLGMIELARIQNDHGNDDLMRQLGAFVKYMQVREGPEKGRFKGYHVPEDHPYYDEENDIVPGEAALALTQLAEWLQDPSWLEPLRDYWTYYQPWFREKAARKHTDAPWPAWIYDNQTRLDLVEFGPWTVMAANAHHRATNDPTVAAFGLEVARWMIESYQYDEARTPWRDYLGGYYKLPHELPAMQAFCYAEGTAAAYQMALRAAPEQAPFFEKATRSTVRFAYVMQFDDWNTYPFSRPWVVRGGIRYAMNETKVRIDYVHHAFSAMYQYLVGARADPALPEGVKADVPLLDDQIAAARARLEHARASQGSKASEN